MENSQVISQRNKYSLLNCWIVLSFVFFIVWLTLRILQPNSKMLGVSVVANLILMLNILSRYRVKRITVNVSESMMFVEKDKWFFVKKELRIPLQNAAFKYDEISKLLWFKVGRIAIFVNTQKIAEIILGISGWSESRLVKIKKVMQDNNS